MTIIPMVNFPLGYDGAPLLSSAALIEVASHAAVKMAEGDGKGLIRLVEGMGIPFVLRIPAVFQLGIGYGISHRLPLADNDFLRLIKRLFDRQFPSMEPAQVGLEMLRLLTGQSELAGEELRRELLSDPACQPRPDEDRATAETWLLMREFDRYRQGLLDEAEIRSCFSKALQAASGVVNSRRRGKFLGRILEMASSVGIDLKIE